MRIVCNTVSSSPYKDTGVQELITILNTYVSNTFTKSQKHRKLALDFSNNQGRTLPMIILRNNSLTTFDKLLLLQVLAKNKADFTCKDYRNRTALSFARQPKNPLLITKVLAIIGRDNDLEDVITNSLQKTLLDTFAKVKSRTYEIGENKEDLIDTDRLQVMVNAYIASGYEINFTNKNGQNLLLFVFNNNQLNDFDKLSMLDFLLIKGVDPTVADNVSKSLLDYANGACSKHTLSQIKERLKLEKNSKTNSTSTENYFSLYSSNRAGSENSIEPIKGVLRATPLS